jgi:hypothetical protein
VEYETDTSIKKPNAQELLLRMWKVAEAKNKRKKK